MSRRESVGRLTARTQSTSGPPTQQMVSVAVLPPRLKHGMAPPTGLGPAETFNWDESINWIHNEPIQEKAPTKTKSFFRKAGLTTKREKINPDTPPFVLRQIPYDVWRKHYAKDKEGNYHGTHAPAEDCLLKPHDVEKWRLGDPVTKGDKWTRGREALPVYAEVKATAALPEYEHDYDGPPRTEPTEATEPSQDVTAGVPDSRTLDEEDDALASHLERRRSPRNSNSSGAMGFFSGRLPSHASIDETPEIQTTPSISPDAVRTPSVTNEWTANATQRSGQVIANGKTAQEIIAEAQAKGKPKQKWKDTVKKGAQYAMLGSNV